MKMYYKKLLEALEIENRLGNMTPEESALLYALADYNVLKIISDGQFDNGKNNEKCIFLLNKVFDQIEKTTNDYIDNAYDFAKTGAIGDY